jgi:hypothetical protein
MSGNIMKIGYRVLNIKRNYLFLSLLSIITGILIYFLFRNTTNFLFFKWFDTLQINNAMAFQPNETQWPFLSFLAYNIPDVLWFLSGLFFIRFLWVSDGKWCKRYAVSFCILALMLELAQLSENIPGTFDVVDFALLLVAAIFEGKLYTRLFIHKELS